MIITIMTLVFVVAVLAGLILALRTLQGLKNQLAKQEQSMQAEVGALTQSIVGMGKKLLNFEKQLNILVDKQNNLAEEVALQDQNESNYHYAAQLIKKGVSIEEVIKATGLTQTEVDLLKNIHGNKNNFAESFDYEKLEDVEVVMSPKLQDKVDMRI